MQAAWGIQHFAQLAALSGELESAARLAGYVDAVYLREGNVRERTEQRGYDRILAILRSGLPEERLKKLLAQGAALTEAEAAAKALGISQSQASGVAGDQTGNICRIP